MTAPNGRPWTEIVGEYEDELHELRWRYDRANRRAAWWCLSAFALVAVLGLVVVL